MGTENADLQTRIAAYMSRQRTRRVTLDEISQDTGVPRGTVSVILSRIINQEARPYPIVRSGRGLYSWVHDPADHVANMTVLAEMIGYMTGAGHDEAAELAATVIKIHRGEFG